MCLLEEESVQSCSVVVSPQMKESVGSRMTVPSFSDTRGAINCLKWKEMISIICSHLSSRKIYLIHVRRWSSSSSNKVWYKYLSVFHHSSWDAEYKSRCAEAIRAAHYCLATYSNCFLMWTTQENVSRVKFAFTFVRLHELHSRKFLSMWEMHSSNRKHSWDLIYWWAGGWMY